MAFLGGTWARIAMDKWDQEIVSNRCIAYSSCFSSGTPYEILLKQEANSLHLGAFKEVPLCQVLTNNTTAMHYVRRQGGARSSSTLSGGHLALD